MTDHKFLVFRFGEIEVWERDFQLVRSGGAVPVEPKAFRVLLFLLHSPGRLVSKDEILKAVWNDGVVSDNSLTKSIATLRRLMGDDRREPRYIATVQTVGYRLVCPVDVSDDLRCIPPAIDQKEVTDGLPRRWKNLSVIVGAAAVIVFATIAVRVWQHPATQPLVENVLPLTDDGEPKNGTLVSDGSRVYFNEGPPGVNKIAQVSVAGGKTAPVNTSLENPLIQAVSPKGSGLLVSVGHIYDQGGPLWSIPLPAGQPRRLGSFEGLSGDIFPNDRIVFANENSLFVTDRDGSNQHRLVSLAGVVSNVEVSPDGEEILFIENLSPDGLGIGKLFEIAADGTGLREISEVSGNECCFHWSYDGKYLVYLSAIAGRQDIWTLQLRRGLFRQPRERTRLTMGPLSYSAAFPSRDGMQIFTIAAKQRGELVRFDMKSRQFLPILPGVSAINITFSRDGKWVAYDSYPDRSLWRSRADGTEPLQLTFPPMAAGFPVISPDGTRVAFHTDNMELFVIGMNGGAPQRIAKPAGDALWSPDGRRLLYLWGESDAEGWLHIIDVLSRTTSTIPSSNGLIGGWWVTQDQLVASDQHTSKFLTYDFKTQKWTDLISGNFANWRVSSDSKYLYYTTAGAVSEARRLRFADHEVEAITSLRDLRRPVVCTDIGVAPDGSPIFTRDIGTQEVYALNVHWP